MVVLSVNDLYLADSFLGLIQKIKNSKSDPDKFTFLGGKLAKVTSKSAKFAKVVLISAKGQLQGKVAIFTLVSDAVRLHPARTLALAGSARGATARERTLRCNTT